MTSLPFNPGGAIKTAVFALKSAKHVVTPLNTRRVLRLSGADVVPFLQGLTTNDVSKIDPGKGMFSAFLNSKGRYLQDVFFFNEGEFLYLDVHRMKKDKLIKWLTKYKLRSKVEIEDVSADFRVWSAISSSKQNLNQPGGLSFADPRIPQMGSRMYIPEAKIPSLPDAYQPVGEDFYHCLRYAHGITETPELEFEKSIILEYNFPWSNGISFSKGCYVGQELMARTHFRGTMRKRIFPIILSKADLPWNANESIPFGNLFPEFNFEPIPVEETPVKIENDEGKNVGKLVATDMGLGLAMLRFENMENSKFLKLQDSDVFVLPHRPSWWGEENS